MVKDPNLSYDLNVEFISFTRALALWEMQTASPRFWTWVAVSISYDGKH